MTSYQTIETPQDYVNYTFNISARGVAEVTGEMAGLSNTITTILGQLAFKTAEYLTHTETLMIGLGTAAIAGFSSATQEAIKFEQAIANVQAIGGESINAQEIGQAAMRYSSQFAMDVNSMTEGLEALSRAGLTATNVMSGVLEEGVKLSKLEGMDLEDSINDLISTTNLLAEEQYDVNSQEYANAVKAMNQHIVSTSESAPINAQNIIQTLQHAGGYVSSSKIDQDDLFAVIAQLGSKGTKGEMAGTALRAFIAAGQKDQAQRALNRIGLDVTDLWDESGNIMLPISEMKQVLDEALEARGYSQQEKLEFYSDFAGYKQANQIMKIDTSEVKEYKETIAQAWDLGKKLDTILGTTHNNIQTLFQTFKNFMTRVGKTTLPIINAIIIPLKWGMQLLEAMPFSENITGMLLAFAGLKSILLLINRVIPSLASMYTSFDRGEKKAKGIRKHFQNIVEDLKQSKSIIEHITDPKYLSNLNFKNGVMGQQSYKQHKDIVKALYGQYQDVNEDTLDWKDLSPVQKEMYYARAEIYKDTEPYQRILKQFKKSNLRHMEGFSEFLSGEKVDLNLNNDDNVTYNKSKLERRQEQNEMKNSTTELSSNDIDKSTKEITNATKESITAIKSLSEKLDQQALYASKGSTQRNITSAILNAKEALAEAIGRAVYQKFNTEKTTVSKDLGDIHIDRHKSEKAVKQLQQIEASVSTDLGDIGYFLDYDPEQIESLIATVKNDLQQKITAYSNNSLNTMSDTQRHRMEKIISRAAKTELGSYYSAEQNNIEVHKLLTSTIWDKNKSRKSNIRETQIDKIEEILGIEGYSYYDKETRLNNIHKHVQTQLTDKAKKKNKIAEILKATENIWIEEENAKDLPSLEASKFLTNGRAIHIGRAVGIDSINWDKVQNPAQELLEYFKDANESKKKRNQLKQADKLMFAFLENDKAKDAVFNEAEAQEIGYIIKRYKQLLLARNKKLEVSIKNDISNATFIESEKNNSNNNQNINTIFKQLNDEKIGNIVKQKILEKYNLSDFIVPPLRDAESIYFDFILTQEAASGNTTANLSRAEKQAYAAYVGGNISTLSRDYFIEGKNSDVLFSDLPYNNDRFTELQDKTLSEVIDLALNAIKKGNPLLQNTKLYHGGLLSDSNDNGFGILEGIRSLTFDRNVAQQYAKTIFDEGKRLKIELYTPTTIAGTTTGIGYGAGVDDSISLNRGEQEYTVGPQIFLELMRNDEKRRADVLLVPLEEIKSILQDINKDNEPKETISNASFVRKFDTIHKRFVHSPEDIDEVIDSNYNWQQIPTIENSRQRLKDLSENGIFTIDNNMDKLGLTAGGDIKINMQGIAESVLHDHFMPKFFEVITHEMSHAALQHTLRDSTLTNLSSNLIIPGALSKEGEKWGTPISEYEAMSVSKKTMTALNIPLPKGFLKHYNELGDIIQKDYGGFDNVRFDLINQLSEDMIKYWFENIGPVMTDLTPMGSDIYKIIDLPMLEFFDKIDENSQNSNLKSMIANASNNGYGSHIFSNDDLGEGRDEEDEYKRLQVLEDEVTAWEDKQRSAPMESNKNIKSQCCSEIKKFLQTITGYLSDYTKFFAKTDTKLTDIVDILSDILNKDEEPPVINNIYNTLNVFQQNMEQGIKALPQETGNAIKEAFLLPQSTINEENIINIKGLVIEDVEKAVLMIDTAYVVPQNFSTDEKYKDSNVSLKQLYDEVYGPKQPKYDTPPLLTSLMALPEKIQEVTTDFILLGEAIDLSKQALEAYLLKNTNLLMLPQGSPKGYHNAYPENAGIFPPLPMDTLTPTRNIYTKRVINEPYNITEQQLRSVGLHGLIPVWQQNLQRFTPYNKPIGPIPDNTDYGKYQQYLAIEDENRKIKKQQEAQAEADLQARETEKLIGITERYNQKMAEQKEHLDAVAQAQNQRYQNFKQEKENLLQLAFAYDIINRAEEKRDKLNNIEYNKHKAGYSFNQGRIGYYHYLNDVGIQQIEQDKRNQELLYGHNQIPKKPTTIEEIENILIDKKADDLLKEMDETIKQLYKAIADRNYEKHILQIVGAYIRSDYNEAIGPLTYQEYVKQSLESMKRYFADDKQRQRDRQYDKQIVEIVDKTFITQDSGYVPIGMPTGLEKAALVKEQQEKKYDALSPEKKGELEIINFYQNEKKLREEEHNRILENENKRTKTIEERIIEEKNIRQGLLNLNKIEERIQAEKRKNIIKERLLIDELNRKFNTGLYELTDEELELIGKGEYSKKGNSRVRADAMMEKRRIEQQRLEDEARRIEQQRLEDEARRIGNVYSSGYQVETIPDITEYQNKVKKEVQKRKQIEENKYIAQQQISQYSAGYDVENIDDPLGDKIAFWNEIDEIEQNEIPSKVEQANAAVEAYKKHQEALQKQMKHQLKKEIEAMDGLLIGFNKLADEAEKTSQQASNVMREQEKQRRKRIEREEFWQEQERLEQEALKNIENQKEALNIANEIGPDMLQTMRHQLGIAEKEKQRKENDFKQAQQTLLDIGIGIQQEHEKEAEKIRAQYSHISGVNVNAEYEGLSDTEKAKMKADHKYGKDFEDKKQSWGERTERFGIKFGELKGRFVDAINDKFASKYPEEQAKEYAQTIDNIKDKFEKSLQPMRDVSDGLQRASEVFPPLAIAASGLNTVIGIGEGVVWALNAAESILNAEETFNILATWGLITAEQAETLSKGLATVATWGLTTAIGVLEAVMLPLVAVVLAVVAAIEILKFAEKQHAEALKESQKALKEATAKNNSALSQYESLKKARENETDVIKKQQLARKEAIALYKLEAARIEKRNAVHKEAKLRNDAVWGEYGLRASLQKMGLGFIAGGDFESQAENYDGTTKNIREIKEATLGNFFATSAQREAAGFYDRNQMFFAEIEAYKKPLQELYDKESRLIEKYGDIDLARGSKEFKEAVQEFADATGINGETAGKMLDWLETENKVDQATTAMQATVGVITARADAKAMAAEYGNEDFSDKGLQSTLIYAQADQIYKDAYDRMWWDWFSATLFNLLYTGFNILTMGLAFGEERTKYAQKQTAYAEGMEELQRLGVDGLAEIGENTAEKAERRDYSNNDGMFNGSPFGKALEAESLSYATAIQNDIYKHTGGILNDNEFLAIQEDYQRNTYGITSERLRHEKAKEQEEQYNRLQSNKKANTTLQQLQNNGDTAHQDALDIIDAIKGAGIGGAGIGLSRALNNDEFIKYADETAKAIFEYSLDNSQTLKNIESAYAEDGLKGAARQTKEEIKQFSKQASTKLNEYGINLKPYMEKIHGEGGFIQRGKNVLKDLIFGKQVPGLTTPGTYMREGGILPTIKTGLSRLASKTSGIDLSSAGSKIEDLIFGRQVPGLTTPGTYMREGGILPTLRVGASRLRSGLSGIDLSSAGSKIEDLIFGRQVPGLTTPGTYMREGGILPNIKGAFNGIANAEIGGLSARGLARTGLTEVSNAFNPKIIGTGAKELGAGLRGGGTLLKGASKLAAPAAAAITGVTTFQEEYEKHDPSKKHYNEDGSEKKAFQSTGEAGGGIAGAITGALAGAGMGAEIGAGIGTAIAPGIGTAIGTVTGAVGGAILGEEGMKRAGEAIGGTIGWMTDEVIYPKIKKGVGLISKASNKIFGTEDNPVNHAINYTSGFISDTREHVMKDLETIHGGLNGAWEYVSGAAGNTWNAITGWLNGGNEVENSPYANIETQDVVSNIQPSQSTNSIVIENININTEDDPEKIKTAFMNLMIELEEQITPKQVSRVIGQSSTISTNNQNGDVNTDSDLNNNNNNNPTV